MIKINNEYTIKDDIGFILESEKINISDLAAKTKISRTTLEEISKKGKTTDSVYEKFYSYAYQNRYRINAVKEEIAKHKPTDQYILIKGSNGIKLFELPGML